MSAWLLPLLQLAANPIFPTITGEANQYQFGEARLHEDMDQDLLKDFAVLHRHVNGIAGVNTILTIYSSSSSAPITGFALPPAFGYLSMLRSIPDQTGDGKRDLTFVSNLGAIFVLDGNTLTQHSSLLVPTYISDIELADMNGDGVEDFCLTMNGNGGISDYFIVRDGRNLQTVLHDIPIADRGSSMILGIGYDPIGFPGRAFLVTYDGVVTVHDLDLATNTTIRDIHIAYNSPSGVVLPDTEGDGYPNLLLTDGNRILHVSMKWGLPELESFTPPSTSGNPQAIRMGDFAGATVVAFSNPNQNPELFAVPGFALVGRWHRAFWTEPNWRAEGYSYLGDAGDGLSRIVEFDGDYNSGPGLRQLVCDDDDDSDLLSNYVETLLGTDPLDRDSDDDGLSDDGENHHRDSQVSSDELDPHLVDSDGDGLQDGTEGGLQSGIPGHTSSLVFIPDADPATWTNPFVADTDGGGILDGSEDRNRNGKREGLETDPSLSSDDRVPGEISCSHATVRNSQSAFVQFTVDFLDRFAGTSYQMLGSFGMGPGIPYGAIELPLRLDVVLTSTVRGNYPPFLVNFRGVLNGYGDAVAIMALAPGDLASIVGRTLFWTCVQWDNSIPNNLTGVAALQIIP